MTDHVASSILEEIAIGALEPPAEVIDHVSTCDRCAAELQREARLELALGEVHAYRAGAEHVAESKLRYLVVPALVLAAAAVLFVLRGRPTTAAIDVRAEPAPAASPSSSGPSDAEEVIAKARPLLRKCYRDARGRGDVPDGRVILTLTIGPDGAVTDVTASRTGLNDDVVACLAAVMRGARFAASGATTTLNVPIAFTSQH